MSETEPVLAYVGGEPPIFRRGLLLTGCAILFALPLINAFIFKGNGWSVPPNDPRQRAVLGGIGPVVDAVLVFLVVLLFAGGRWRAPDRSPRVLGAGVLVCLLLAAIYLIASVLAGMSSHRYFEGVFEFVFAPSGRITAVDLERMQRQMAMASLFSTLSLLGLAVAAWVFMQSLARRLGSPVLGVVSTIALGMIALLYGFLAVVTCLQLFGGLAVERRDGIDFWVSFVGVGTVLPALIHLAYWPTAAILLTRRPRSW